MRHEELLPISSLVSIGGLEIPPFQGEKIYATCAQCGNEFETARVILTERVIEPATLCEACTPKPKTDVEDREEKWRTVCPDEIFRDSRFVSLAPEPLKKAFRDWETNGKPRGKGIYATGPTGTFKTTLCWYLLRRLHFHGKTVAAYRINKLADDIADSFTTTGAHGNLIQRLATVNFLLLDDLDKSAIAGKSQAPPSLSKALFEILDRRCSNNRPTFITTNARAPELDAIYGEQFAVVRRRLLNTCIVIETGKLMPPKQTNFYEKEERE